MSFKQGITNRETLQASQTVTASTALVIVGANTTNNSFSVPIALGQKIHFRINLAFTVGASGGFKFRLDGPVPTSYVNSEQVTDGVTASPGAEVNAVITALTDFANAFASVAGNHTLKMEGTLLASAAGNLSLQMACNSAAGAIIALAGSYMEVTTM